MKKLLLFFVAISFLMVFNSCKKDETKTNYFSFDGKDYPISETALLELISNEGTPDEDKIFILNLSSITYPDTTDIVFTFYDNNSTIFGGNYPLVNAISTQTDRGYSFFLSGIMFQDGTEYFFGGSGSVDVSVSGTTYDITINNVCAGEYGDMFDLLPEDGDDEFVEIGKIKGNFKGTIIKETSVLSLATQNKIEKIKKAIEDQLK